MFYFVGGAPGQGKTYLVKNYLLPTLALQSSELTRLAPAGSPWPGCVLIADPPRPSTGVGFPEHQRFTDVSELRRASQRELVCCLDRPHYDEMMRFAWELSEQHHVWSILVFDEMPNAFPMGPRYRDGDLRKRICNEGRHFGVAVIGCGMRLGDINADARKVLQGVWISDMSDSDDRDAAGELMGRGRRKLLDELKLETQQFLEWNREFGRLSLVRIVDGRKVVEQEL